MDNSFPDQKRHRWMARLGFLLGLVWAIFLAYVLLVSDPPDFWFDDVGKLEELGHVVAGIVTGFVLVILLATRANKGVARSGFLALLLSLFFLFGLEGLQFVLADRGAERSDLTNSVIGSVIGVGVAVVGVGVVRWWSSRRTAGNDKPE